MFKAILISEGVPFLGINCLSIVSEDFQGHSFNGKQLSQVADDNSHDSRGHLKYKGVFGKIMYNE